jgi:hypothetical protein
MDYMVRRQEQCSIRRWPRRMLFPMLRRQGFGIPLCYEITFVHPNIADLLQLVCASCLGSPGPTPSQSPPNNIAHTAHLRGSFLPAVIPHKNARQDAISRLIAWHRQSRENPGCSGPSFSPRCTYPCAPLARTRRHVQHVAISNSCTPTAVPVDVSTEARFSSGVLTIWGRRRQDVVVMGSLRTQRRSAVSYAESS